MQKLPPKLPPMWTGFCQVTKSTGSRYNPTTGLHSRRLTVPPLPLLYKIRPINALPIDIVPTNTHNEPRLHTRGLRFSLNRGRRSLVSCGSPALWWYSYRGLLYRGTDPGTLVRIQDTATNGRLGGMVSRALRVVHIKSDRCRQTATMS